MIWPFNRKKRNIRHAKRISTRNEREIVRLKRDVDTMAAARQNLKSTNARLDELLNDALALTQHPTGATDDA